MNNDKIISTMIDKVEEIVRNKVKEDFNEAKTTEKKTVSKAIINELEAALKDED